MKHVWRKVVDIELWRAKSCPKSALGTYKFILECGHMAFEKASQGRPQKKICRDCEHEPNVCKRPHPCVS